MSASSLQLFIRWYNLISGFDIILLNKHQILNDVSWIFRHRYAWVIVARGPVNARGLRFSLFYIPWSTTLSKDILWSGFRCCLSWYYIFPIGRGRLNYGTKLCYKPRNCGFLKAAPGWSKFNTWRRDIKCAPASQNVSWHMEEKSRPIHVEYA